MTWAGKFGYIGRKSRWAPTISARIGDDLAVEAGDLLGGERAEPLEEVRDRVKPRASRFLFTVATTAVGHSPPPSSSRTRRRFVR